MKVIKNINKILKYCIFIVIFFMLVGITYSYFVANLIGVETNTTITADAGKMDIVYDGGSQINATGLAPSDVSFGTKNFTVTGTSTIELSEIGYKISLIIDENTLSKNAISFTLESTNTSDNGSVLPSIEDNIYVGTNKIEFGIGKFIGPVSNAVHTYQMKFYFLETGLDQTNDISKTFKAHILIENYSDPCISGNCLKDEILAQEVGGEATIEAKGNPDFSAISTSSDTGLYAMEDEYGTSYYFRGNNNLLKNNLIFGGFQWKITRINGDGSIRILYNGTEEEFNQTGTMSGENYDLFIDLDKWNEYTDDIKYVGYMYGGVEGEASNSRLEAVTNETSSNVKIILDEWYEANFLNQTFENKIADNLFCNNRLLSREVGGYNISPGYGNFPGENFFVGYYNLYLEKMPTLKCSFINDQFTVTKRNVGNGALTYPIGLITADEVSIAGLLYDTSNSDNYLYFNYLYWTMTPFRENLYGVSSSAKLNTYYIDDGDVAIRPVINLKPDVVVTGEGTLTNPYIVD